MAQLRPSKKLSNGNSHELSGQGIVLLELVYLDRGLRDFLFLDRLQGAHCRSKVIFGNSKKEVAIWVSQKSWRS